MSNARYRSEFLNSHNKGITLLEGQFQVNSAQTTAGLDYKCQGIQGTGIKGVTNVGTGIYRIDLAGNFPKFLGFSASVQGPIGTPVAIASLSTIPYVVSTVGTSAAADWIAAGVSADFANRGVAVGLAFVGGSGASGATGTGYAAPIITSGITMIQVYGDPNQTLISLSPDSTRPCIYIQTLYDASSNILAPAAPVDLSIIRFNIMLRNSNLKGSGE